MNDVLSAERELYRAMITNNPKAIESLLAPDLVYVHSTAVAESRDEYLAGVAEGLYEYESVTSRDTRVRLYGDVALIDGVCDMRVGERGKPAHLVHLLFMLAWVRQDGAWRLVHRHAVRIPE
jgi:ketosteroid isomerase-like protein